MNKFFHWLPIHTHQFIDNFFDFSEIGCDGWVKFDYMNNDGDKEKTVTTFHGTSWYSVPAILKHGRLVESCEATLGYAPKFPGVYSTEDIEHALEYTIAQCVFNDGIYHGVVLELAIDEMNSKKLGKKHRPRREEWVSPSKFVNIVGVWCKVNMSIVTRGQAQWHLPNFDDALEQSIIRVGDI